MRQWAATSIALWIMKEFMKQTTSKSCCPSVGFADRNDRQGIALNWLLLQSIHFTVELTMSKLLHRTPNKMFLWFLYTSNRFRLNLLLSLYIFENYHSICVIICIVFRLMNIKLCMLCRMLINDKWITNYWHVFPFQSSPKYNTGQFQVDDCVCK